MLFARPFQHIVQQFFQLAVVTGGKAGKRNFVIAGVLAQYAARFTEHACVPLAHGPVQKTGLAKTAPAHTSAQHFNLCTVMHSTNHGHHKVARKRLRVHIGQNSLCHYSGCAAARGNFFHPSIREIRYLIQLWHIHARYLRQLHQNVMLAKPGPAPFQDGVTHIWKLHFPLAQHKQIEEIGQGLGVAGTGAARHHKGCVFPSLAGQKRNAAKLQHGKDIGVGKLVLQCKAHHVKF